MKRVAIEAVRVSRALTGDDPQRRGEAGYEGEVPGSLDENAFRSGHGPGQAFAVIRHARQVIVLGNIDERGNGNPRERGVGEGRRVRRHEHDRPYPRIAKFRDVANLAGGFPNGCAPGGAEPGVVGMPLAMRDDCVHTRGGAGDGQRGVAAIRMAHNPDAPALDVRPELSVFQDRINDAGDLLWAADPHPDTGYVVVSSPWMRGGRDDVTLRTQRQREVSVVDSESPGSVRDDDQPEVPSSGWRIGVTGNSNAIHRQRTVGNRHGESESVTKRGAGAATVGYHSATGNGSPVSGSFRSIVR